MGNTIVLMLLLTILLIILTKLGVFKRLRQHLFPNLPEIPKSVFWLIGLIVVILLIWGYSGGEKKQQPDVYKNQWYTKWKKPAGYKGKTRVRSLPPQKVVGFRKENGTLKFNTIGGTKELSIFTGIQVSLGKYEGTWKSPGNSVLGKFQLYFQSPKSATGWLTDPSEKEQKTKISFSLWRE